MTVKLIAISGAHGTGKSTLLENLKNNNYKVDDFKVSRTVLSELGQDLETISQSIANIIFFQNLVFERKYSNDKFLKENSLESIHLVERSFADIFVYTKYWLQHCKEFMNISDSYWLRQFEIKCYEAQKELYETNLLLLPGQFELENDGIRPVKISQQVTHSGLQLFFKHNSLSYHIIENYDHQKRLDETITFLEKTL